MKSILLASASVVAFAGAASAAGHSSISWSGSADFSYNSVDGFATGTELTASASASLNNGLTATASVTIDADAGTVTDGDVTLASDTASVTYSVTDEAAGAAEIGVNLSEQTFVAEIHDNDDGDFNDDQRISGSATISGMTIRASMNAAAELQVGVATDLSGASINVGYDQASGNYGAVLSTSAAGIDVTAGFASGNAYGISLATTVAGADVTADFGDAGWSVGASMSVSDALSVEGSYSDGNVWSVGGSYAMDPITLGFTYNSDTTYEVTVGYVAGTLSVDALYDGALDVEGSYDLGGGLVAYVGALDNAATYYAGAEYDLGNGASVLASYNTGADETGAREYENGTTVAVSFEF